MDERQIRTLILYEFLQGTSARQAAEKINAVLGSSSTTPATAANWYRRFAAGDTSVESLPRSGRPAVLDDDELRRELEVHPDQTTRELAQRFHCSNSTVDDHLHALGYRKVLSRWTPHALTDANRAARVSICQSLLLRPHRAELLADLVTGDESWILYENDTHHAYWLPRGENPPAQPKPEYRNRKVLLCCFWDERGMLYYELLTGNETVNANVYSRQLRALADAIREKRRRRARVVLLHDNARPHVAAATRQQLESLNWETLPHPAYSPDIAPSDFHLFRALKNSLRGKHFVHFSDLESELDSFFQSLSPEFWARGIHSLPERWAQVVDAYGEYTVD
jgi:histone-lysine N-methyltransferase SETMAR